VQEDVHDEQAMALYQSSTQWGAAEAAHTLSLFYMAQMYGRIHKVDLMQKYVLVTLERQLQLNQEYERLQWATNASNLSIFYSDRGFFPQAYLCLKAAEHMLPSSVFPIPLQPDQDNASAEQRLAVDVLRAWGKFYLSYLQHSGSAYAQVVEEGDPGAVMEALHSRMGEFKARNCSQPLPNFASLSLEAPPALSMLVDFKAASEAFKQGLKAFDGAKRFYQLDGFVTDHIMIVQNISALYMHLVLFEPDLGRRCKMHKRRINLLEPFLDSVNPKVYSEFYQQVSHEVARCYSHMGDLKRAMNEKRAKNSEGYAAAVLKANELTLKAVQYFQIWQNTFVSEDEDDPDMIGEDYYEVYLNSLFHTARLFTKIVHASPQTVNMFLQKAVDFYKRIVMLAEKWELQADVFADELRMSKEMIELLPMKIDVLARTNSSTL
jgi:tetratricopeptide (TPR) repeat protein